jgi:hypothetical protein
MSAEGTVITIAFPEPFVVVTALGFKAACGAADHHPLLRDGAGPAPDIDWRARFELGVALLAGLAPWLEFTQRDPGGKAVLYCTAAGRGGGDEPFSRWWPADSAARLVLLPTAESPVPVLVELGRRRKRHVDQARLDRPDRQDP